ncbi:unnamed protein product, partial [Ixodes pacificus]
IPAETGAFRPRDGPKETEKNGLCGPSPLALAAARLGAGPVGRAASPVRSTRFANGASAPAKQAGMGRREDALGESDGQPFLFANPVGGCPSWTARTQSRRARP